VEVVLVKIKQLLLGVAVMVLYLSGLGNFGAVN